MSKLRHKYLTITFDYIDPILFKQLKALSRKRGYDLSQLINEGMALRLTKEEDDEKGPLLPY